jgi:hypothetical protein
MGYKTLSVRQPYATLICAGIKTVENRTWKTDYRGRILIHASGDQTDWLDWRCLPKSFEEFIDECDRNRDNSEDVVFGNDPLEDAPELFKRFVILQRRLFGYYNIHDAGDVKCLSDKGLWKEKLEKYGYALTSMAIIGEVNLVGIVRDSDDYFAERDCFHWILDNAVWYDKPVSNVVGRLRLWNYEGVLPCPASR